MKKVFIISCFLFLASCFSFPKTAHAFSLWDLLFPPTQIKNATRKAPNKAVAPEIPSDDSYSNTLKNNTKTCNGETVVSNSWSPKTEDIFDENGNKIGTTEVPQDAENLNGNLDLKNISNEYYRNFQSFFARGASKCTHAAANRTFNSLEMNGTSASLRSLPSNQINYYRSQFLVEATNSLNESEQLDTVAQDYQLVWDCQGTCQELNSATDTSSCRPVYLSELVFGLQNEKLYYPKPDSEPENFPPNILTPVLAHYSGSCGSYGCYSHRSNGKSFVPLPKEDYLLFYKQLNFIPKGNVNSKVTITNYYGWDMNTETATNPRDETYDRTLPNAASAYSPNANTLSFVSPSNQKSLENTDICDDTTISPLTSRDVPQELNISAFVKGLIKHLAPGESFSKSYSNHTASTYDKQIENNVKISEQAYSNMLPSKVIEDNKLLEESFSSKSSANGNAPIVDPGYRSDKMYQVMRSLLRPSNW